MPKRKISEDFACPGCQEQFDTRTGAPFGDCDHSLCPACVNEKIESCPICSKEGGSTSKQKNNITLGLLASGAGNEEAEQSKKPRMFFEEDIYAADAPIPAIVNPENRSFLAEIVNQLDPRSFLKLARSCKYLYNFCFNSKEVKIIYSIGPIWFWSVNDVVKRDPFAIFGSNLNMEKLKNYPFHFHLKQLDIHNNLDEDFIASLRSFFSEFSIVSIKSIYSQRVGDWNCFLQLLKDFHITDVWASESLLHNPIPDDVLGYILQNSVLLNGAGIVPDHFLLNASVRKLQLWDTKISQATFIHLIKRFANSTEEITWNLGREAFEFGHYDLFKVLSADYETPLPEERPLIFARRFVNDKFYILRKDGKVVDCTKFGYGLEFSTNNSYGVPPVFPDPLSDWDYYWYSD